MKVAYDGARGAVVNIRNIRPPGVVNIMPRLHCEGPVSGIVSFCNRPAFIADHAPGPGWSRMSR